MKYNLFQTILRVTGRTLYCLLILTISISGALAEAPAQIKSVKEVVIRLDLKQGRLDEVLKAIEQKSDFRFFYTDKNLDMNLPVTLSGKEVSVAEFLLEIARQTNVHFRQVNYTISVKKAHPRRVQEEIEILINKGQETITGKVTDENGEGLPGATVLVKGTSNGTITDIEGNYSINVGDDASVLVFSFVGYVSKEVPIEGRTVVDVSLSLDVTSLEEIVVVGYGSVRKSDLTGAVETISSRDLAKIGTTSPMAALQGQVAGVNITPQTGLVGSDFNIQIRGVNSLTGGKPLFVVDGVMTDNINFLNPNDIQQIDILKDASSTAIYGSRGSNGVVIVTTKSGEGMKGQGAGISYSAYVGVRTIANMPDFLDAEEGIIYNMNRDITKKLYRGDPLTAPDDLFGFPGEGEAHDYWVDVLANKNYTDWVDLMMKPSIQTNHFISASGGGDKVSYMIGAGYQGENGNIEGQTYKKYNFKGSVDARVTDQWSMGTNINLAYSDRELRSRNAMKQVFRMPPWTPAYDQDGEMIQVPMVGISSNVSPLAELKYNKYNTRRYYLISNFYLQFKPIEAITLRSTFSPNLRIGRTGEYWDPLATKGGGGSEMSTTQNFSYIWDNQLSVNKRFGDHQLNYDFIYSMQLNSSEYLYGFGWELPFNSQFYNVGTASFLSTASSFSKSTLLSYTNRLNYVFRDKYLFTATIRWDGSSRLADGHKWAYFPSAAVAWKLSNEPFIQSIPSISNLKLRLSYGYTGNNNVDPYTTQFAVTNQTYYDWNGTPAKGFRPSAIANKELTWERTREWNLGLDFGFFGNRISGEMNVYDRLSLDLLMKRKLAVPTGWGEMYDNVGSVSNRGIELQLRTVNVETGNFSWETNFIFSRNINKIVELYGKKEDDVANRWFIGEPVEVVYAMVFDGVWQRDELSDEDLQTMEGTAKVKDLDGSGTIDVDNDMKVLGSPIPDWIGSFSTTLTYKNWDLSATMYTKQGVFLFSPFHQEFTDFNSKQVLDVPYYMRENPYTEARYSNEYPQPAYQGTYWGEDAEDYGFPGFNKDASFVRLQNVTLGYNLGRNALERLGLQEVRIYVNALNPMVWTEYDGFDPEWGGADVDGENANSTSFSIYQIGTNIKF